MMKFKVKFGTEWRFSRLIYLPLVMIITNGCAEFQFHENLKSQLSDKAIWVEPPYVHQEDEKSCGLAVIAMLTQFYKKPITELQRQVLIAESGRLGGIKGATLVETLKNAGYFATLFPGTIEIGITSLYENLNHGRPLIVMLEMGESQPIAGKQQFINHHYVLVTGYDPATNKIVLYDPAQGKEIVKASDFSARWERDNRFTILAIPEGT